MKKQFILAVLVILTLSACAPVRLTTSLKKRPEIYRSEERRVGKEC